MKRFLTYLSPVVAVWAFVSFVGVMLDPARANVWTQSLMWSLISSALLAPFFIFVTNSSSNTQSSPANASAERFDDAPAPSQQTEDFQKELQQSGASSESEEEPFDDNSQTLWPNTSDEETMTAHTA
jgi:hypothetical protein